MYFTKDLVWALICHRIIFLQVIWSDIRRVVSKYGFGKCILIIIEALSAFKICFSENRFQDSITGNDFEILFRKMDFKQRQIY